MRTYSAKPNEIEKNWILIDAKDKVLGRLSTEITIILRGKNKPNYTPHMDVGDFVVVINADQIRLTGAKWKDKIYHHHTGYFGGLKSISAENLLKKHPERLVINAVSGMLPKNKLRKVFLKKLKVCAGVEHGYQAQKPEVLELES